MYVHALLDSMSRSTADRTGGALLASTDERTRTQLPVCLRNKLSTYAIEVSILKIDDVEAWPHILANQLLHTLVNCSGICWRQPMNGGSGRGSRSR